MGENQLVKLAILAGAILALVYVMSLYNKKKNVLFNGESEQFEGNDEEGTHADHSAHDHSTHMMNAPETELKKEEDTVKASESLGTNEVFQKIDVEEKTGEFGLSGNQYPKDCFPKDQLTPGELLPGDANSKWAQSVPAGQGELGDQNFLTASHHIGVNTVGQTLRNANRQLRSEPPNPQVKVSPWLQTTIEADTNRRPLEIGGCE